MLSPTPSLKAKLKRLSGLRRSSSRSRRKLDADSVLDSPESSVMSPTPPSQSSQSLSPSPLSSPFSTTPPSASTASSRYTDAVASVVESSLALESCVMNIPDPLARDGSRPLLAPVGLVLAALIALPTIPLWFLWYCISRPEGFNHIAGYVLCRTTACTLALTPNLPPVDSPSRRGRPGIMQVFDPRGITKKVSTTKFTIPPLWPEETHPPLRPQVESISLTAFMLASPGIPQGTAPAEPGEKLILYLHGGGYVDGHPLTMPFAFKIAHDTKTRLLASTYRKVLDERSAFPAPLVDAHAAWEYARRLGFESNNILLLGDSAGGHLCLYLAQHLAVAAAMGARLRPDEDPAARLPGGIALVSPWVDMTLSFPSWATAPDYLPRTHARSAVRAALRHYAPCAASSAPLSPVFAPEDYWRVFERTPVFISYGSHERIADEDRALVAAMRRDGVPVTAYEEPGGLHCGPIAPWSKPEAYLQFAKGVQGVLAEMGSR